MLAGLLAMSGLFGCGAPRGRVLHDAAAPLSFATFPFRQREALVGALEPLSRYLGDALGRRVRFRLASSYRELEELVAQGQVDFGWFTPRGAAAGAPPLEVLCRPISRGGARYHGSIVARRDSGIRTLRDLAGHSFAYVDRSSHSGFGYPNRLLAAQGLDPVRLFSEIHFAGNHDRCLDGVLDGLYAAGAVSELALADPARAARVERELTVVATTEDIPPDPVVVRSDLDPEVCRRLSAALIDAPRRPGGAEAIAGLARTLGIEGFEPVDATKRSDDATGEERHAAERTGSAPRTR